MYKETPHDWHVRYSNCWAKLNLAEVEESLGGLCPIEDVACVGQILDSFSSREPDWDDDGEMEEEEEEDRTCVSAEVRLLLKNKYLATTVNLPIEAIDLTPLPFGMVNLKMSCVNITSERIPPDGMAKYRALPFVETTRVEDPFYAEREIIGAKKIDTLSNPYVLDEWGKVSYPSALDALNGVISFENLSIAFSPEYSFGLSAIGDAVFLYRYSLRIARVLEDGEILLKPPVHRLFEQLSEYGLTVRKVNS